MKRLRFLAVFFSFLFVFSVTACGGGGGGGGGAQGAAPVVCNPASVANGAVDSSTCAITCDSGYTLSGATCVADPVLPRIKREGFKVIPETEYAEQIVSAMNESFAQTHSDWQTRATGIVSHVNTILNRNSGNKKSYVINKFMTYLDANATAMAAAQAVNGEFYIDNLYAANPGAGGTTVFNYVGESGKIPAGVGPFAKILCLFQGKVYSEVWTPGPLDSSLFTEISEGSRQFWSDYYDHFVGKYAHELGHSLGLAAEDRYNYIFSDQSGESPDLAYNIYYDAKYATDPMVKGVNKDGVWKFTDMDAWIINHNANHQYNGLELLYAIPAKIFVKVVDSSGIAVGGATVKAYGALDSDKVAQNMSSLLETLTTDGKGEVILTNDFPDKWLAKGVKASFAGKYTGKVLTLIDLQTVYLMEGQDTFVLVLTLQ
mgnify:CR=1 FL=1